MKKKIKKYQIKTFKDFTDVVNEKNIDMLCGNFYGIMLQFIKMRKMDPKIQFDGFLWIDDGKIEVRSPNFSMEISNSTLEEIKNIQSNNSPYSSLTADGRCSELENKVSELINVVNKLVVKHNEENK